MGCVDLHTLKQKLTYKDSGYLYRWFWQYKTFHTAIVVVYALAITGVDVEGDELLIVGKVTLYVQENSMVVRANDKSYGIETLTKLVGLPFLCNMNKLRGGWKFIDV